MNALAIRKERQPRIVGRIAAESSSPASPPLTSKVPVCVGAPSFGRSKPVTLNKKHLQATVGTQTFPSQLTAFAEPKFHAVDLSDWCESRFTDSSKIIDVVSAKAADVLESWAKASSVYFGEGAQVGDMDVVLHYASSNVTGAISAFETSNIGSLWGTALDTEPGIANLAEVASSYVFTWAVRADDRVELSAPWNLNELLARLATRVSKQATAATTFVEHLLVAATELGAQVELPDPGIDVYVSDDDSLVFEWSAVDRKFSCRFFDEGAVWFYDSLERGFSSHGDVSELDLKTLVRAFVAGNNYAR